MPTRLREVPIHRTTDLSLYRDLDGFDALTAELRSLGAEVSRAMGRRKVWMISSTASGGGVAEMMPRLCSFLADVGVEARWLVLEPGEPEFFRMTKALHNMLHGQPGFDDPAGARAIYERVSEEAAQELRQIDRGDIVVIHDPQPAGIASRLRERCRPPLLWRCHVGIARRNRWTDEAWRFLRPYLAHYRRLFFSLLSYAPDEWLDRSRELCPGIDPFSHKNRSLRPYKLVGILRSAGLVDGPPVPHWAAFRERVCRWSDAAWVEAPIADLLHVPTIVQVSRFDRLKGFAPLIPAFRRMVEFCAKEAPRLRADSERVLSEVGRAHLILAGPDPAGIADDPEARDVLEELCGRHAGLDPTLRERVHILRLPMADVKENALMVNALQRIATVAVQNSIEEGFGLTVSEALWKRTPVVAANVGGIAAQVRQGSDGLLVDDPGDPEAVGRALLQQISSPLAAEAMARSGRLRVREHFTILSQVRSWLHAFGAALEGGDRGPSPAG